MEKNSKLAKIVLWVLFGISIVLFVILFTSIESEANPGARAEKMISVNINWAIILFAIAGVIALVFATIQILGDKKRALSALFALAGFALVIAISYAVSGSDIPQFYGVEKFVADGTLTPSISRWIGTGLVTTYILFVAAALSVIVFGVASVFKRS
jgi:hypothetical protein